MNFKYKNLLIGIMIALVVCVLFFVFRAPNLGDLVTKCAQKYPNYETIQKTEFEECIGR